MKYWSTKNKNIEFSAGQAVFQGLPEDNGLFMPESIPTLSNTFLQNLSTLDLTEIGLEVLRNYFSDIPAKQLEEIINRSLYFPIPLNQVSDNVYSLELYHGPTLAFKDVGAGFLAGCLDYYAQKEERKALVLVATSGDTGSAVANGFYGNENVDVIILFPKGKISDFQEKQMTTLGKNITSIEIDGTFDDCQHLVKQSFLDNELHKSLRLTSANSINIARFISQSVYYFYGISQLDTEEAPVISVPSGNFGNLTAGLIAQKMGLKIKHFIASTNRNDIVPEYLESGKFNPRPSIATISNAMDVGNPSNFVRIMDIYGDDYDRISKEISGYSFTDRETVDCIERVYHDNDYILDPHGAVGYLGLEAYFGGQIDQPSIFLETAHPFKFKDHVEKAIKKDVPVPLQAQELAQKEPQVISMGTDLEEFKDYLRSR